MKGALLGYFDKLVEALTGLGYVRDKNLMSAPYDWRKAPQENEEFTYFYRKLIEVTYALNLKRPVILLCHGMGCTFSYHFLRNQPILWKSHFVKAMIAVSSPWGGTVETMYSFLGKDDTSLVKQIPAIRYTERTFSSKAFQLPQPELFRGKVLVETVLKNYSAIDYKAFFAGLGYPNAYYMWEDSNHILAELKHPEVDVFCVNGLGFKTIEQIVYKKAIDISDDKKLRMFQRFKRKIVYGNGDGVVNLVSLRRCLLWQEHPGFKFHYQEFHSKHNEILKDTLPVSHILNIVTSLKYVV
jgi:lysophospholipase-3